MEKTNSTYNEDLSYDNINNDDLINEYNDLVNEAEASIQELKEISTLINLDDINLCDDISDDINGILANMCPNALAEEEEIMEFINSDEINELLTLDIHDQLNDFFDGDMSSDIELHCLNSDDNYAIIEFGDDYVSGEAIQYNLFVQPGDEINSDTIIGEIFADNKWKPIKSIFSSGTVMSIDLEDNKKDFFRLYSEDAQRHIIIHPYELGSGNNFTLNDINDIQNDIKINGYQYNLLKDHLIYSLFPILISKMESYNSHIKQHVILGETIELLPHPAKKFNKILETYEEILQSRQEELMSTCSADNIKKTGGKTSEMSELGNKMMDIREDILNDIILKCYKNIVNDNDEYQWNPELLKNLITQFSDLTNSEKKLKENITIGGQNYYNYYTWLLSRLDTSDNDNKLIQEYYLLLYDIIINRIELNPKINKSVYIKEINNLYNAISGKEDFDIYTVLNNKFGEYGSYTDILMYMYELSGVLSENASNSNMTDGCVQLTNLYMFIRTIKDKEDTEDNTQNISETELNKKYYELIKSEAIKIEAFWNKVISDYQPISNIIDSIKQRTAQMAEELQWPIGNDLKIDCITYKHFLFKNPLLHDKEVNDGDDEAYDYQETDNIDITALQNQAIPMPSEEEALEALANMAALEQNENDLSENEITIYDTEYWQKYFSLATIITLPPVFWADGFDVMPLMTPTPMPGIYICFHAHPEKDLNLIFVFGLAIRGIYIYPIIQCVNTSSATASPMTPIIKFLEKIKKKFMDQIAKLENSVPNIAGAWLIKLVEENEKYINENQSLTALMAALANQVVEDKGKLRKELQALAHPNIDLRLNIFRTECITMWNSATASVSNANEPITEEEAAKEDEVSAIEPADNTTSNNETMNNYPDLNIPEDDDDEDDEDDEDDTVEISKRADRKELQQQELEQLQQSNELNTGGLTEPRRRS